MFDYPMMIDDDMSLTASTGQKQPTWGKLTSLEPKLSLPFRKGFPRSSAGLPLNGAIHSGNRSAFLMKTSYAILHVNFPNRYRASTIKRRWGRPHPLQILFLCFCPLSVPSVIVVTVVSQHRLKDLPHAFSMSGSVTAT